MDAAQDWLRFPPCDRYRPVYLWDSLTQSQLSSLICVPFTSGCAGCTPRERRASSSSSRSPGRCVIGRCECEKVSPWESLPGSVSGPRRGAGRVGMLCGSLSWKDGFIRPSLWGGAEGRRGAGVISPLPQVRGSTGEPSHYEVRWALSVLPPLISPGKYVHLLMNVGVIVIGCVVFVLCPLSCSQSTLGFFSPPLNLNPAL